MREIKKFREMVYCRRCNNKTHHGIILEHCIEGEDSEIGYYWSEDYIIGQCLGCDTVNFIKVYNDASMHYYDFKTKEFIEFDDIKVYPPEPLNNMNSERYDIVEFQHLPELLNTLYKQVVANFEMKYYLLAAAGMRMIIEGICNDLSIKKGFVVDDESGEIKVDGEGNKILSSNLNGKINGLVEHGVLTEGQTVILHIIRKLGNQTVHKLNNPKRKILRESLEIIEQTFRNIYELKKYDSIAEQLKKSSAK